MSADDPSTTNTTTASAAPTSLLPAPRPLNLAPITLKEAALDSPSFRASSTHFGDQIDLIERWLDNYVRSCAKLVGEITGLEETVSKFLSAAVPPVQQEVLDHDYTLLALRRYGEAGRSWWDGMLKGVKRYEYSVLEPVKAFLNGELRHFKDARRGLEAAQKTFDHVLSRYAGQSKTKEASSLREDAFQVHEARRAYLKASMDFCVASPNLRASLDKLIVRIFAEQVSEMKKARDSNSTAFAKWTSEVERVKGWSREMEGSERVFKQEVLAARQRLEAEALKLRAPSRELEDYGASTVAYIGSAAPLAAKQDGKGEMQGWLYMKTSVGKPARTVWTRRWFYVQRGIFGWLTNHLSAVMESEHIGVLLCSVRPAFQEERRFCWEVKTKDTTIVLQAETQQELSDWLAVFEMAKRKALEDPGSTESTSKASGSLDPAFAVTAPISREFAAQSESVPSEDAASSSLGAPDRENTFGAPLPRASFDVSNGSTPSAARRVLSLEREPGEGNREHATRLMQKLDLHKRGSASTSASSSAGPPAGGIASLIASSHNILQPIGAGSAPTPAAGATVSSPDLTMHKRTFTGMSGGAMAISSLAPSTLANPPVPTSLSQTAVVVSGERAVGGANVPLGLMANMWGSRGWGAVNRLGTEATTSKDNSTTMSPLASPTSPPRASQDDVGVMDGAARSSTTAQANPMASDTEIPNVGIRHRKTASVSTDVASKTAVPEVSDTFPPNYPLPLKVQQAQFRLLFPSVPREERVVLVFRASWNADDSQEFPGRVYVTTKGLYFYSNHLGLILVTGASLGIIDDVTAAPGRECDYLYLHLRQSRARELIGVADETRRITVKVFLEPLRLLQRRLDYLVHNASSDASAGLEEVIRMLVKMEVEEPQRSSSVDSWEDVSALDTIGGASGREAVVGRNVKTAVRVDGSLLFDSDRGAFGRTGKEVQRFKLPAQPVNYAPQDMHAFITRDFAVSAKALFHVIFGDKSAVFQLLYCNRWADRVVQTPWLKGPDSHFHRHFSSSGTPAKDEQTIEIYNDHLLYAVTNRRAPYKLPYAKRYVPVTKMVITHSAKSRCRLAIYQKIEWSDPPRSTYLKNLVEKLALNSLEADALDLSIVAMDQVAKLGHHSKTNRAIEVFGPVGQQTEVPVLDTGSALNLGGSVAGARIKARQPTGLLKMVFDDLLERALKAMGWMVDILVAVAAKGLGALVEVLTGHTVLVALLAISSLYNAWSGYKDGLTSWHERRAVKFMTHLGVKPDPMVGKAIWLKDMEELAAPAAIDLSSNNSAFAPWLPHIDTNATQTCQTTFNDVLASPDTAAKTNPGAVRLHRTRSSLARYRHDLLVALRVVNRVERDVVEAEYEQHIRAEMAKCERIQGMLRTAKGGKSARDELDLQADLGEEFAEYCRTCMVESARLDG